MERVSRLTMADIIPSIDSLINQPVLGTCYKFKTDIYRFHDGMMYRHVFGKVILCLAALNVSIKPLCLIAKDIIEDGDVNLFELILKCEESLSICHLKDVYSILLLVINR